MNAVVQRKTRRAARVQTNLAVTLLVKREGKEKMQAGFATNISDHGIGIRTQTDLDAGQQIHAFTTSTGLQFGACRVVWSNKVKQGQGVEAGLEILN